MLHRAGFVNIVGEPNAGKSTLFNKLVQLPLSIATDKPQTTRQNILGIRDGENYQVIYVDTPGYLKNPAYQLQRTMMRQVRRALVESDVLLWLIDMQQDQGKDIDPFLLEYIEKESCPFFILLNKRDVLSLDEQTACLQKWLNIAQQKKVEIISFCALKQQEVDQLAERIIGELPHHPPYYDKGMMTDKSSRFFAADMIRKAIFLNYKKEIPYSTEVLIELFKNKKDLLVIEATIYVEKINQKRIMIGHKGNALKRVGMQARKDLEKFFGKKVFLKQHVQVVENWRNQKNRLTQWGYL